MIYKVIPTQYFLGIATDIWTDRLACGLTSGWMYRWMAIGMRPLLQWWTIMKSVNLGITLLHCVYFIRIGTNVGSWWSM